MVESYSYAEAGVADAGLLSSHRGRKTLRVPSADHVHVLSLKIAVLHYTLT
jgi:hypothetical protein